MWRVNVSVWVFVVVAAACGALAGCAAEPFGWRNVQTHAPLPATFQAVEDSRIGEVCGTNVRYHVLGCAIRDYPGNVCVIYHARTAALWLLAHEALHCAGVDHL